MQRVGSRAKKGAPLAWLLEHVDYAGDDCLTWPFGRKVGGYGQIFYEGKPEGAHRVMCQLAHGAPPSTSKSAAHTCGKGHLACVNPRHLKWKTPRENIADKFLHGTDLWGDGHPNARLTNGEVIAIIVLRGKMAAGDIAKIFGTTQNTVNAIQMRTTRKRHGDLTAFLLG